MGDIVKFGGKKPAADAKTGPYWAGQPMKEAFPGKRIRSTDEMQARTLVIHHGELCFIEPDGPEGAA